jgi:hypothetical protein
MGWEVIQVARLVIVIAAAIGVGVAVAFGSTLPVREVLVAIYGPDLSVIDNTLPMLLAVSFCYVLGAVVGFACLAFGWRRFVRA